MYYLLLHKWEKGQLQLPLPINPAFNLRGHLSTGSIPPTSVPQINVQGVSSTSPAVPQWQTLNAHLSKTRNTDGSCDINIDDNLQRYLNLGRRHTLGTAHNVMIIPQDDMNRLRKINESVSSQASSGFGSSGTNAQIHPEIPISVVPTLSSTGLQEQVSIGSMNSTSRTLLHLHPPTTHRSSKRRASDGGHYAAAYRTFIEMRKTPLNGLASQDLTGSNSIRQLLHDKIENDKRYGRHVTAQKQWILYKDQLNVNQYSSTGLGPNMTIPSALPPIVQLSTMAAEPPHLDLRQQLQPFYEYSPQQIQEQLQHLHLRSHDGDYPADEISTFSNQMPPHSTMPNTTTANNSNSSSSSINTTQSRKSSTSSSLIAQLLSPPTPPMSINLPSSSTMTPSASTAEYVNGLDISAVSPRRYSVQPTATEPSYSPKVRQKRNTLPILSPTRIPNPNDDIPLFNTDSFEGRDDFLCTSPETSYLVNQPNYGRRSPVHLSGRTSPLLLVMNSANHDRSTSPTSQQQQRQSGVNVTSEHTNTTSSVNQTFQTLGQIPNGTIHENQLVQGHLQQIPIFLNQHISLIHPKVANQIAHQQVGRLVSLISTVLNNSGIVYEYNNGNIFTVSHQGVEFQIHVQVSSHYTMQNALQLNLQYMHISGDPQLYQSLCTQLAPNFIPNHQ